MTIIKARLIILFAALIGVGAFIYYKYTEHKEVLQKAASQNALSQLSICAKSKANALISKGEVLTNGDIVKIKDQCNQPASTNQDQAEALRF